ncbi:tyrosine-protein kinase csk-1-like [Onthophagus taurus]|uniref:tyrosine-protein kinase csk-1-like n=1 Tax=Onthophagus taurus TaxID=166361 RepID=UPI0039BE4B91
MAELAQDTGAVKSVEIVENIQKNPNDGNNKEGCTDLIPWYHGKISDETTYKLLKSNKDGLFLVRDSLRYAGDFSLCLTYSKRLFDYRIIRDNYGRLTINLEDYYDSLEEIIETCIHRKKELCYYLMEYVTREMKAQIIGDINVNYIKKGVFGKTFIGCIQNRKVLISPIDDPVEMHEIIKKKLCHKNLVNIIGLALTDSGSIKTYNMITVYMEHEPLLNLLRKPKKYPYVRKYAFNFCNDICMGMVYLEEQQLCHQFLAAKNVWITKTGIAKLANFGICNEYLGRFQDFAHTHVAPEVLIAKKHSIQADMWSFGVVLWEIYNHGNLPYSYMSLSNIFKFLKANNRLTIPTKNCPRSVRKIMRQCWCWKPEQRPIFRQLFVVFPKHRIQMKDCPKFLEF